MKMEIMAEAAITLWGFSALLLILAVLDMVFLAWDKLYKHLCSKKKLPEHCHVRRSRGKIYAIKV